MTPMPRRPLALPLLAALTLGACHAQPASVTPPAPGARVTATAAPIVVVPARTSTPTATPAPTLTRLTEPGCCTVPTWSADSAQVRFIDRPTSAQPVGLYAVGLDGGPPTLISERLGEFSPDDRYVAYPEEGETYVEDVSTGRRWTIDNGGRLIFFSPSSARLAWSQALPGGGAVDRQPVEIVVMSLNGTPISEPFTLYGGSLGGWMDDDHLFVAGRLEPDSERALYRLPVANGAPVELARGQQVRIGAPAPGGAWAAYLVLFDQEEPTNDGLWIVSADGQTRFKLDLFGPFQWRNADHLLVVPQEMGAPSHRLVEIDARTGQATPLTDPDVTPFVIEGGDWGVAPDGKHVVFLSALDRAIWLLTLP